MKTRALILTSIFTVYILLSSCVPALQGASTVSSLASISTDRRTAGVVLDDKTLHLKFITSGAEDAQLEGSHINYMIYDKSVLVAGEVPSKEIQSYVLGKIQILAPNIKQIYNETTIGPTSGIVSRAKDSAITLQVEVLFQDQEVFHPTHVRVMTENQNVYLMGAVTDREGSMAAKIAANARGVKRVVKMFDYLAAIPDSEIEKAKAKEKNEQDKAALEQLSADLEAEKLIIQQKIDELNSAN
jgi:osmotically-inducible protein OsmY